MGRVSRRLLTAFCSIVVILILFWAGSGEKRYWESTHVRVVRNSDVISDLVIDISSHKDGKASDMRATTSDVVLPKSQEGGEIVQLSDVQPTRGQSSSHLNQARRLQDKSMSGMRARVLLMSYMRSGSTFTGDIFQSSPVVFYLYEPLIYVNDDDHIVPSERPARTRLVPNAMGIPNPPEIHNYTLDTLNCRLTDHNLRFLYALTYSNSTVEFNECQKRLGIHPSAFGECGNRLRTRCEQSQAVVSKILRLKMWEVEKLLAADPDLKVIHLVRDPRGVYISRMAARYYFAEGPFCARLNEDAKKSAELQVKYPDRILTTRYEDLATNPFAITKILFDFGGVPWSGEVEQGLKSMTSNSDVQTVEHKFNTKRKNSTTTASSWRQKISFQKAYNLQEFCKFSMEMYGYIHFQTIQEVHNLSLPSFQNDYSDQFYKAQVIR